MAREGFFHDLLRSVALTILSLVVSLLILAGVVWFLFGRGPDIEDGWCSTSTARSPSTTRPADPSPR